MKHGCIKEMTLDCTANHSDSQGSFHRILGFSHHWLPLYSTDLVFLFGNPSRCIFRRFFPSSSLPIFCKDCIRNISLWSPFGMLFVAAVGFSAITAFHLCASLASEKSLGLSLCSYKISHGYGKINTECCIK